MAVQKTSLKQRLQAGEVVMGCLLAYPAPWLVEILGLVGCDFITLDLEHEPFSDESVADLIRTADGVGLPSIVRMEASQRLQTFLNAGARGVQVPDVDDCAHAEAIVRMTRFPPTGRRPYYSQTRLANYGLGTDERKRLREVDDDLLVIGMIESIGAVDRLDEILAVEGIDAFHIGPLDLAESLGHPPRDRLEEVIDQVIRRCRAVGKHVAVGVVTPWGLDAIEDRVQQGVQIFNVASAWLLTHAVREFFAEAGRRIPSGRRSVPVPPTMSQNTYLARPPSGA